MSGEFGIFIWSNKCGFDEYPSVCGNQFWEVKCVSVEAVCFIPCCPRKSVGDKVEDPTYAWPVNGKTYLVNTGGSARGDEILLGG